MRALKVSYSDVGEGGVAANCDKTQREREKREREKRERERERERERRRKKERESKMTSSIICRIVLNFPLSSANPTIATTTIATATMHM